MVLDVTVEEQATGERSLLDGGGLDFMPLRYTHDWDFLLGSVCQGGMALMEEPLVAPDVEQPPTAGDLQSPEALRLIGTLLK